MKTSTLWLWVFCACASCLPAKGALDESASDIKVLSLNVRDARGGSWPLSELPRAARLELALSDTPDQPEKRVWLVQGALDDQIVEDLLSPPLSTATQKRVVEIALTLVAGGLVVSTLKPLTRDQRYSLAVLEAPEQLWARELRVSNSPASGAAFVESQPADQARGIPPNLQQLLLRFDGYLEGAHQISLKAGAEEIKTRTALLRCSELGLAEGDCIAVRPMATLPSHASLALEVRKINDATGGALEDLTLRFDTADTVDDHMPSLLDLTCALDERALDEGGCVLEQDHAIALRLAVDEPTMATLSTAHETLSALSFGRNLELALTSLEPGLARPSSLSLTDLAGNTRKFALRLNTLAPLATLSIEEVRCDPIGPEPAQETIELLNFGREPVQIMGFSLSDDALEAGVRIRDDLTVLPDERVLIVGPMFDARDGSDGTLSPGVRLARTDKALSIGNQGSLLFLRDTQSHRLSAAPRIKPAKPGACIARHSEDPRSGAVEAFAADPNQSCTPGAETTWP